jgi:hypothetical protein
MHRALASLSRQTSAEDRKKSYSTGLDRNTEQMLERLTLHGFPKALDFLKEELFGIRSPRRLGKGNVDLSSNCFQLVLRVLELVVQGSNQS